MKIENSFFISNSMFDYGLTPKAFYVFCYLKRCKNQQTGRCFPSHATMEIAPYGYKLEIAGRTNNRGNGVYNYIQKRIKTLK